MFLRLLHQVRMHTIYFHCPETQMTISGLLALTDFYFQHKNINYIKFKNFRINNIRTCMINLAFLQLSLSIKTFSLIILINYELLLVVIIFIILLELLRTSSFFIGLFDPSVFTVSALTKSPDNRLTG